MTTTKFYGRLSKRKRKIPYPILVFVLLFFVDLSTSNHHDSTLQLSVHPNYGYVPENIEVRCQISKLSKYHNIYLSVKSDHVKPSGIILMVDTTVNSYRTNKVHNIDFIVCNSSLILIHINHTILHESVQRIDYECRQGDEYSLNSFRILSKKSINIRRIKTKINTFFLFLSEEQTAHYYDSKSNNSSSSLMHTSFLLVLFILAVLQKMIIKKI